MPYFSSPTINTVHDDFQSVGTGKVHNNLISAYQNSAKGFVAPSAVGSGKVHNNLISSQFEYILGNTLATVATSELSPSTDLVQLYTNIVTEYGVTDPNYICLGPDNNLWVTRFGTGNICKLTTSGTLTTYSIPGSIGGSGQGICAGPDGNLYFYDQYTTTIWQVTTSGVFTGFAMPNSSTTVQGLCLGLDNNIWICDTFHSLVWRMTTAGVFTSFSVTQPYNICSGPDGNLWTTNSNSTINKITTSGSVSSYSLPAGANSPIDICTGPDNNLWYTNSNTFAIGKITTSGTATAFTLNVPPSNRSFASSWTGICLGPDENLWVCNSGAGTIGKFVVSSAYFEYQLPLDNQDEPGLDDPLYICSGSDGNLWFTEFGNNTVAKITPTTEINANSVTLVWNEFSPSIDELFTNPSQVVEFSPSTDTWNVVAEVVFPSPFPYGAFNYYIDSPTIEPVHYSFMPVGSGTVHNDLFNFYKDSAKAYTQLSPIGTGNNHNNLKLSSYKYITPPTELSIIFNEFSPSIDSISQAIILGLNEFSPSVDSLFTLPLILAEFSPSIDEVNLNVTIQLNEFSPSTDSLSEIDNISEFAPSTDIVNLIIDETIAFNEFSPSIDVPTHSANFIESIDIIDVEKSHLDYPSAIIDELITSSATTRIFTELISMQDLEGTVDSLQAGVTIQVESYDSFDASTTIQVEQWDQVQYGTNLGIIPYNLVPVTNASSLSNPFTPTLIINGQYVYQNAATDPGTTSGLTSYVSFNCGVIEGVILSDVYSFSLQLNDLGGTFEMASKFPPGALGNPVTIFGLQGTITKLGRIASNSAYGYITSGVFGSPYLNNQLIFEVSGNLNVNNLTPNATLQQPNSSYWQTYQTAAQAIAGAAGISLVWMVPDAPLVDFYPQSGITALAALSTLAEGVGAKLRWYGNNTYLVLFPNFSFGVWNVPNCNLINAGGLRYQYLLNVENEVPMVVFPALQQYPTAQTQIISNPNNPTIPGTNQLGGGGFTTIQNLGGPTKLLKQGSTLPDGTPDGTADPSVAVPLPDDTQSVYVQVLIAYPGDLSQQYGATWDLPSSVATRTTNDINNPLSFPVNQVSNRDTWFIVDGLTAPGIGIQTVFGADGQLIRRAEISPNFFSQNTNVQNSHFTANIGVVRLSLEGQFQQAQQEAQDQQNYVLSQQVMRYKFIPIYEGSIDTIFWGAMPLPGMEAFASVGGVSVTGTIENVSFSFPGVLSVGVKQYQELNFITNYTSLTANPPNTNVG